MCAWYADVNIFFVACGCGCHYRFRHDMGQEGADCIPQYYYDALETFLHGGSNLNSNNSKASVSSSMSHDTKLRDSPPQASSPQQQPHQSAGPPPSSSASASSSPSYKLVWSNPVLVEGPTAAIPAGPPVPDHYYGFDTEHMYGQYHRNLFLHDELRDIAGCMRCPSPIQQRGGRAPNQCRLSRLHSFHPIHADGCTHVIPILCMDGTIHHANMCAHNNRYGPGTNGSWMFSSNSGSSWGQ